MIQASSDRQYVGQSAHLTRRDSATSKDRVPVTELPEPVEAPGPDRAIALSASVWPREAMAVRRDAIGLDHFSC